MEVGETVTFKGQEFLVVRIFEGEKWVKLSDIDGQAQWVKITEIEET